MKYLLLLTALLHAGPSIAQVLKGITTDAQTGEALPGVVVKVNQRTAISNNEGFFEIKGLKIGDSVVIEATFLGYRKLILPWKLSEGEVRLALEAEEKKLDEVVIEEESYSEIVASTQMGKNTLPVEQAKMIPSVFGEVDILKVLQLKPGVQSGGEGSSGLFVRGGGPDQNLILMDGAQVYNAAHLFGFFSIFNSDAVRSVDLYKSGFPASFGGRLSSVIDVKIREPNLSKFSVLGGIGLISSRLTLEIPLFKKTKTTLLLSGRRTYVDIFTRAINRYYEGTPGYQPIPDYAFDDFNAKFSVQLSGKDRLVFSGYLGRDRFLFRNKLVRFNFIWGNDLINLSWFRRIDNRTLLTTSVSHSRYRYELRNRFDIFGFSLGSFISDWQIRSEWEHQTQNHQIKIGSSATWHRIDLGRISAGSSDGSLNFNSSLPYQSGEYGLYLSDEYQKNQWKLSYGVRISSFYRKNELFAGTEPRFAASYQFIPEAALKVSFTRMYQYLHLISNTGATLPTDLWYPSGGRVKPQISDQISVGSSWNFYKGKILFTHEVYYKNFQRQIDFRDGAQIFFNPEVDKEFVFGNGFAYGSEFYIEKRRGKLSGWIGYTLSWTKRKFPDINGGRLFPPRNDQRHNISIVAIYALNSRLSISATWVYNTGNAISLPIGRFFIQNIPGSDPVYVPVFTERNSYRMASYHRLDLGVVWKFFSKRGESDLTFNVFNAYDRRNPYFIYFEELKTDTGQTTGFQARQVSLFPILPSITYNFKF